MRLTYDQPIHLRGRVEVASGQIREPVQQRGVAFGLERRGLSKQAQLALKRAYRTLFNSTMNISQAIEEIRSQGELTEEVEKLVAFIEASERGVTI